MTVSAPVRDLLQLALGSFPRSQEEKDRSRALLRCAYRGRTRKVRLSIVENCGGPGSGKPGPCPLYRASDQEDDDANEAQGGYQALGAGVYLAEDPESVKGYGKYIKKYSIPNESLLSVAGDIGLQPHRDAAKEWADSKIKEHLKDAKDGKIKINGQLLAEMTNPASQLRAYLESKGYKGIRYVQTDKKNDHHSQVLVFRREHLTRNTTNARPLKTDIRIKELAPYLHDLLGDVTKRDARAIARIVKRGVERRWKDSSVARAIARSTKIEPDRAKVIARTEMARARTDVGLGKKRDSDKVVFTLGNKDRACPICRKLAGKVYTVRKAAGVIPRHPNCFCFWSDAPKGARVSNSNPKGCNQYSGKDCSNDRVSMADMAVRDKWVRSTAIRIGNPSLGKSPEQLTDAQYNSLPIVYHGGDATSEHIFVTDSAKLAASHGDVKEFRLSPGATLYADPESQEELEAMPKHLRRGHVSLRLPGGGSAIVKRSELWPKNRNDSQVSNVFCATGEGGGVDPSCGADGSKGSRVGAKFASMPSGKATSKESKKWRKDNQKNYDEDPEFRAVADSVALYTQGDYNVQRAFAQRAVTGRLPAEYEDSAIPGWVDKKMHGSALANYKTYFSGQEWMTDRGDSSVTYAQAGRALTNAVADSPPIPTSLYRGLEGRRATLSVKDLKPGDDFDILAPTSFTSDETIGQEFARGVAKGQGRKREESEDGVIFEVLPGARGLPVSAISPWDQKEVLTSGKFKVKEVRRNGREPVHVVLEQVSVHRALLTTNSVGGSKEETEVVRLLAKRTRPFPHQF